VISPSARPGAAFAAALPALVALFASACVGPRTEIDNPAGHRVFLDGTAVNDESVPFRYYGESRWDALPADRPGGDPDWSQQPSSQPILLPPPASPWLFPLDLPLETLRRVVYGREDVTARITLAPTPANERIESEVAPTGQVDLVQRAVRARLAR